MRLKFLFPLILGCLCGAGIRAENNVPEALLSAPFSVVSPLSNTSLSNLIDLTLSGADYKDVNLMQGEAYFSKLDSLSASLTTGCGRRLDIYMLPAAKADTVIAIIETLETSAAPDSRLSFYSTDWKPLENLWGEPDVNSWLTDLGRKNFADFERNVDFILAEYAFDPSTGILTLTNNTETMLNDRQRKIAQPLMRPSLQFQWTARGFKPL